MSIRHIAIAAVVLALAAGTAKADLIPSAVGGILADDIHGGVGNSGGTVTPDATTGAFTVVAPTVAGVNDLASEEIPARTESGPSDTTGMNLSSSSPTSSSLPMDLDPSKPLDYGAPQAPPVPEPSSALAVVVAALAGLGAWARRRASRA